MNFENHGVDLSVLDKKSPLTFDFFMIFSRFEYALKSCGLFSNNRHLSADWDKFVDECLDEGFFCGVKEDDTMKYIIENPPKNQIVRNGKIEWEPSRLLLQNRDLFLMIRRTRNNLFHGGKGGDFEPYNQYRNERLFRACIEILLKSLSYDEKLKEKFEK